MRASYLTVLLGLALAVSWSRCQGSASRESAPTTSAQPPTESSSADTPPSPAAAPAPTPKAETPILSGEGDLRLPAQGETASGETHTRHPFKLPPSATGVVAEVRWNDTSWKDVIIAVGTGICPHRGKKLAEAVSSNGRAEIRYEDPGLDPNSEESWFLHVNADAAAADKAGQTLHYAFAVRAI